jgi:hypothetical protein
VVFAAYGVAAAQTGTTTTSPPGASVGMQRQVQLSPREELTQADTFLGRMSISAGNIGKQLEAARTQRDVVKSLCLNDKLNQVDVALRSARERRQSLEQAVNRGDADLSNHEFTILTVLRQRVEQLGAEANQCIGEEMSIIGDTRVSTTIDTNLPTDDVASVPPVSIVVTLPPPQASPFK